VPLRIRTSHPACFLAAGFPVVRALIDPAETLESARLLFRPEAYPLWYELPMRRSGPGFLAVLPKPRPSARRVHYVVEVTAPGHPRSRGQELSAPVVEEAAQCGGAPADMMESAAIAVRVPRGAPAVPPVPPGFVPVGAVGVDDPVKRGRRAPLVIAGAFAGLAAGILALPNPNAAPPPAGAQDELAFLDSNPPPDSHISIGSGATLTVRMRVRTQRALGGGLLRVVLYSSFGGGPQQPCAVLEASHAGFPAGTAPEVTVSGPLRQARVCQPSDRMRLEVEENGQAVLATGSGARPDVPARYFLVP
jgi:hypothetical protein